MKSLINSIALFVANAMTSLAYYVIVIMIARRLGTVDFGDYVFAIAYGGLFMTLPNFGLDRIFIREVARQKAAAGRYLASAGAIRLVLVVFSLVPAVLAARWLGYSTRLQNLIVIFFLSLALNLFSELFRSLFYAFEAMPFETLVRACGRMVTVVGVVIVIDRGAGLVGVAWAVALTALIELLLYGVSALRRFKPAGLRVSRELCSALTRASLPVAMNTTLVVIYFKINIVILKTLKGAEAAGWFGAAFTFVQLLQLVSGSVAGVALPVMSRHYRRSGDQLLGPLNKATYYLMLAAFPLALGTSVLSPHLIGLIYGNQYAPAVESLRIIIWASVFMFLGSIYGTALIVLDKQLMLVWIAAGAVVVNVALNFALIPSFSLIGGSVATVITEACVALLTYLFVHNAIKNLSVQSLMLKPVGAAGVMGVSLYVLRNINWTLQAVLAAAVYLAALIIMRGIPQEDWRMLLNFLRPERSAQDVI